MESFAQLNMLNLCYSLIMQASSRFKASGEIVVELKMLNTITFIHSFIYRVLFGTYWSVYYVSVYYVAVRTIVLSRHGSSLT